MNTKPSCDDRITTMGQVERIRAYYNRHISILAMILVPACIVIGVVATVLPDSVPSHQVWPVLRPLWNPIGLIFLLGAPFIPAIRYSRYGRQYTKLVPVIRAVKVYDRAIGQYAAWREKRSPQALLNSYECVNNAQEVLRDLPEFMELRQSVLRDYTHQFERGD